MGRLKGNSPGCLGDRIGESKRFSNARYCSVCGTVVTPSTLLPVAYVADPTTPSQGGWLANMECPICWATETARRVKADLD